MKRILNLCHFVPLFRSNSTWTVSCDGHYGNTDSIFTCTFKKWNCFTLCQSSSDCRWWPQGIKRFSGMCFFLGIAVCQKTCFLKYLEFLYILCTIGWYGNIGFTVLSKCFTQWGWRFSGKVGKDVAGKPGKVNNNIKILDHVQSWQTGYKTG